MWQVDVIMVCAVLVALEPARQLYQSAKNWLDRRAVHLRNQKEQQEQQ